MRHTSLPFARKRRQFQYLSRRLRKAVECGDFQNWSVEKRRHWLNKWHRLYRLSGRFFSTVRLRRLLGAAAVVLGLTAGNHSLQAQSFAAPQVNSFGLLPVNENFFMPTLVDIDADGDLDVVVCTISSSGGKFIPYFLENVGSAVEPVFGEYLEDPWGMALSDDDLFNLDFADVDGDGDLDAFGALTGYGTSSVAFWENIGTAESAVFGSVQYNPFGMDSGDIPQGLKTLRLADVDGDGDQDLLLGGIAYDYYGGPAYGGLFFFENTGSPDAPVFGSAVFGSYGLTLPGNGELEVGFFDFADMDGDGDEDLLCAVYSYDYSSYTYLNNLYFYENQSGAGNISFAEPVEDAFGLNLDLLVDFLALGDLDGDSDTDILSCHLDYFTYEVAFHFYENQEFVNQPPVSDTAVVSVFANNDYAFSLSDFPYSDADNDPIAGIRIESLIDQGMLTFQGNPVTVGLLIPADQVSDLVFRPEDDEFGEDYAHFNFSVFDGLDYSEVHTMTIDVMQNVGTQQLPFGASAKCYPNPAPDFFQLDISRWPVDEVVQLDLLDWAGRQLIHQELQLVSGELQWLQSVRHLPKGQYLLRLKSSVGTYSFPLIKQ